MPTIRDWTYITVVAFLLVTYAAGLISQTISASAAERGSICMITGNTPG
jgi:hypothetical protein